MEQDKTAKDEIAQGMADAGKAGGKPAADQGNQPGQPKKDTAEAGGSGREYSSSTADVTPDALGRLPGGD